MSKDNSHQLFAANSFRSTLLLYLSGLIFLGMTTLVVVASFGEKVAFSLTPILAFLWVAAQLMANLSRGGGSRGKHNYGNQAEIDYEVKLDDIRKEMQGRMLSFLGTVMGEISFKLGDREAPDAGLLEQAIEYSRGAYEKLKGSGVAEFMALNNLIFFLAVQGDEAQREFVLEKARELKKVGERYKWAPYLLTYCKAVLRYGGSADELDEVHDISMKYQFDPRVRAEARDYWINLIELPPSSKDLQKNKNSEHAESA